MIACVFIYFVQDIDIIVTYGDHTGAVQVRNVRSRDLSASWVWKIPGVKNNDQSRSKLVTYHNSLCLFNIFHMFLDADSFTIMN